MDLRLRQVGAGATSLTDTCPGDAREDACEGATKPCCILAPGWETPLCVGQTLSFLGGDRVEVSSSSALCETTRRHALCWMLATGWKFLCPRALRDKLAGFRLRANFSDSSTHCVPELG